LIQGFGLSIDHYQKRQTCFPQAFCPGQRLWTEAGTRTKRAKTTSGGKNLAAKQQAILDPRNTPLIERFLKPLVLLPGGDQLNWYTLGGRATFTSPFGSWSITNDASQLQRAQGASPTSRLDMRTAALAGANWPTPTFRTGANANQNFGSATPAPGSKRRRGPRGMSTRLTSSSI